MFTLSTLDIMTLLSIPGVGPARARKVLDFYKREVVAKQSCVDSLTELTNGILTGSQEDALSKARAKAETEHTKLSEFGAHVISILDPNYPLLLLQRLGESAPLILLCKGNVSLFQRASVGFCGSRAASEKGIRTAWDSASILADHGVNVVSGFAAGVDLKAHHGALAAGGTTTVVLAEGLLRFRIKKEIRSDWDDTRTLVVSEFSANQPWSVGQAMQRNRTICALSNALLLIEARLQGGSMEAGRECLKMGLPLFAAVYEGMPEAADGNDELLRMGAKVLMKSRTTNRPNIARILEATSYEQLGVPA